MAAAAEAEEETTEIQCYSQYISRQGKPKGCEYTKGIKHGLVGLLWPHVFCAAGVKLLMHSGSWAGKETEEEARAWREEGRKGGRKSVDGKGG